MDDRKLSLELRSSSWLYAPGAARQAEEGGEVRQQGRFGWYRVVQPQYNQLAGTICNSQALMRIRDLCSHCLVQG